MYLYYNLYYWAYFGLSKVRTEAENKSYFDFHRHNNIEH